MESGLLFTFVSIADFHIRTEIESGLCGLVVGHVFGDDAEPVGNVLQEGVKPVVGRVGCHKEVDVLAVGRAHQHFFTPIA